MDEFILWVLIIGIAVIIGGLLEWWIDNRGNK
jgi:hypothetical protein